MILKLYIVRWNIIYVLFEISIVKKILVTLGPSSMNKSTVSSLTKLGVYLFRINLSHTPLNLVKENIKQIQSWTDVPICLDSEGAQLRNGLMQNDSV